MLVKRQVESFCKKLVKQNEADVENEQRDRDGDLHFLQSRRHFCLSRRHREGSVAHWSELRVETVSF